MKPIGYWLNRTDKALTQYMNGMLNEFGLTRTAWQVLSVIRDTPDAADADIRTALAPNADRHTLTTAIDAVLADDWATRPAPGRLVLTATGRRRLLTVEDRVNAFRQLSTLGITTEDYHTAVSVLERMTHNLEA
ncbi:MarR family winged helix-turn-helix transcriptional regulator [Kitasatospora sp. NPDC085895]|uniref:MarR family winged helix-turn-helix transcriptional regulator n=1 Tax=Kitasatospora sp. NPDC085895 TaxID=3155057 RepID=UPI00344CC720